MAKIVVAASSLPAGRNMSSQLDYIKRMQTYGADLYHLDVMDGAFVPNFSFGTPVIASIRPHSKLIFDVHLMIKDPLRYVDDYVKAGADIITFHLESDSNTEETIKRIKSKEVRCGLAISPATPVEEIIPYLSQIDMALIMTVVPGFGGQSLIPETLEKVRTVKRYADSQGLKLDIEVDGGLNPENIHLATEAGANIIVAGSAVFGSKRPRSVIAAMRESAAKHPYQA